MKHECDVIHESALYTNSLHEGAPCYALAIRNNHDSVRRMLKQELKNREVTMRLWTQRFGKIAP